ncbi:MBL fold metallo-hydrolase [Maricaulis sp. CAU 1757]
MVTIPFVQQSEVEHGRCEQLTPLIRRVIADNPGPFTYTGTGVYIIGRGTVAVIDPGPDTPRHAAALHAALGGETVSHVLVTHHHLDHCPLAHPLARQHGARVHARSPAATGPGQPAQAMEEGADPGFRADVELADGDSLHGPGWTLEALATPGHTANHVCFALHEENALFTGDHVMGWATSVVLPPDGHMGDYLASLQRVRERDFATLWPTHGPPVTEPGPFLDAYIAHRMERERQILAQLQAGETRIRAIVERLYTHINRRLFPAAAQSVLAHLIHLVETGRARIDGERTPGLDVDYRPVTPDGQG